MSNMRQKNQLELAFTTKRNGEAGSAGPEGPELLTATTRTNAWPMQMGLTG